METKPLIFVIDDDESVRDAFSLALVDEPYQVVAFASGKLALEAVKTSRPNLVFLDLNMPVLDGVEVLRGIMEIDDTICVYVVTAFANDYLERLRQARDQGLKFQIASKPINDTQIRLAAEFSRG